MKLTDLASQVINDANASERYKVAIAGPPAFGKTTIADKLYAQVSAAPDSPPSTVVPVKRDV
ncbi:MAG: hypothetical protein WBC71_07740 [Salaquimonas sp.]